MILLGIEVVYDLFSVGEEPFIDQADIDDCLLGRITPEELGYPDESCDKLMPSETSTWFSAWAIMCQISFWSLLISAIKKDTITVELLHQHSGMIDNKLQEKLEKLSEVSDELMLLQSRLKHTQNMLKSLTNDRLSIENQLHQLETTSSQKSKQYEVELEKLHALLKENKQAAEKAKADYYEAEEALHILKKHGFEQTTVINNNISDSVIMGDVGLNSEEKN